jgi:hypothetical protein
MNSIEDFQIDIEFDKLGKKLKKLKEYYVKSDFSKIRQFFERLYDGEDLLDVESDFDYELMEGEGDLAVNGAAYQPDRDKIVIYVHPNIIEDIDSGKRNFKNDVIKEAELAIAHEEVHRQQNQLDMWSNTQSKLIRGQEDYKGYISQVHEIDAHAAGIAEYLKRKHNNKTILGFLSKGEFPTLRDDFQYVVDTYKEIGGKVWEKFLKEIYDYIEEPLKKSDKLELKNTLKGEHDVRKKKEDDI